MPLDLPANHISILRGDLTSWLEGVRSDLETPERVEDPDRARQEAEAYERLLAGLMLGHVFIPDESARAALAAAAKGADDENGYAEVVATHDALHGLLALLEEGDS